MQREDRKREQERKQREEEEEEKGRQAEGEEQMRQAEQEQQLKEQQLQQQKEQQQQTWQASSSLHALAPALDPAHHWQPRERRTSQPDVICGSPPGGSQRIVGLPHHPYGVFGAVGRSPSIVVIANRHGL